MINFDRLGASNRHQTLEPRDIFMSLPTKHQRYSYPRDVQTEVWKQWFNYRNRKNVIIKMNTGSGKTVVGLTILQSCLNEGKGTAVYVVPDNYLVEQVHSEAKGLGIRVTTEEDYSFREKKAILIINIHKLVNGKSIFGLRSSGNIQIGSIIIDDVHACFETIEQQYTIFITSKCKTYNDCLEILGPSLKMQSEKSYTDITENGDPRYNMQVPFWVWQSKCQDIYRILKQPQYAETDFVKFSLPLIEDSFEICNCVVSSRGLEITPKCIPISKISSFETAERRIFMSATLADDSVFVSALGLNETDLTGIITPEKANDIGDRLILFPQHLNPSISDEEIKTQLVGFSQKYNVVVLVPSFDRANFWQDSTAQTLSSRDGNIDEGVTLLKTRHMGLTVLVNKYDGIDLPEDACRILVIDGLPAMRSEYDMIVQSINPSDRQLCREQIQKIEQGMGRGVRSNNDYCVIVFMGRKLSDAIINQDGINYFSKATYEQYKLSRQIWDQLMESTGNPSVDEIFNMSQFSLNRDLGWVRASKDVLSFVEYDNTAKTDPIVIAFRKAFEQASIKQYSKSVSIVEAVKDKLDDNKAKGCLMQIIAEYKNFISPIESQEILLSAKSLNSCVLNPLQGIQHQKLIDRAQGQSVELIKYLNDRKISPNNYIIKLHAIMDDLVFSQNSATRFEEALKNVSFLIGIRSSRPENENGKGPDNLWCLGNGEYLVVECKSRTVTDRISKKDCNQLGGSINWFENEYEGNDFHSTPVMIHNCNIFEHSSSPNVNIRIMTPHKLDEFKRAILAFANGVVQQDNFNNPAGINSLLLAHSLLGKDILKTFTVSFEVG